MCVCDAVANFLVSTVILSGKTTVSHIPTGRCCLWKAASIRAAEPSATCLFV